MKFLSLLILLFISTLSFAQKINNIPLKDLDVTYVEIMGVQKGFFTKKVKITIDYGQHVKLFDGGEKNVLYDANDKPLIFNSMMDALNFFDTNGFEYVNSYAYAVGNINVYHHLLRKKKQ